MAQRPAHVVAILERHQVAGYLIAIALGAAIGLAAPDAGPGLGHWINPVLGFLLYVTFLQVPAAALASAVRDRRFLGAALVVNFAAVPVVVAGLSVFLPGDRAIRLGVLLVLLCPCVDYVIVFCGLAGGDNRQLLAATPVLLLVQMALLPVYLFVFMGTDAARAIDPAPFLRAFLVLIAVPLALAWATQAWAARRRAGRALSTAMGTLPVPLMGLTLLVVVASQVSRLSHHLADVARVVPVYIAFLVVMAAVGLGVARTFGLGTGAARAIIFTGATRNSLVVLPLALALPGTLALAGAVVVTQTLVEVLGMVTYVRLIPRLVPPR